MEVCANGHMSPLLAFADDLFQGDDGVSTRTQFITTAKNILIAGGDATERLMSSYKEVKDTLSSLCFRATTEATLRSKAFSTDLAPKITVASYPKLYLES